ncbi:MAG: hypothetical protein MRY83_21385 [Flavobacteriales bacterium]|nr:hypothetical protein [Flavobacteriales bacterium]
MKNALPIILCFVALLFSCGSKSDEEYRAKERKKMQDKIDSYTVDFYKALKITVRSLPFRNDFDSLNKDSIKPEDLVQQEELTSIQDFVLNLFHAAVGDEEAQSFSTLDYVNLAKGFSELRDNLKNKQEDDFPTLLEIMDGMTSVVNDHEPVAHQMGWSKDVEHMVLFALIDGSRSLPAGFGLYELSQIKEQDLPDNHIKVFARTLKAFAYLENGFPYLAEEIMTLNINELEAGRVDLSALSHSSILEAKISGPDAALKEWHGISAIIRAFSRYKMDREDKQELAIDDLELFLADAEEIGIDNELTWVTGTYLALHNEEAEEALKYLNKLEKSEHLGQDELEVVAKIKGYVEERDTEKAFIHTRDQLFTGKMVFKYLVKKADRVEWKKMWNESYPGKAMTKMVTYIDTEYAKVKSYIEAKAKFENLLGGDDS